MAKSAQLRLQDSRAIWLLLGDCRDLGDERIAWRERLAAGLADLVDADLVLNGEMGGCRKLALNDLGVTFWWRTDDIDPGEVGKYLATFRIHPAYSPTMLHYHRCNLDRDGAALRRSDFVADRDWYRSFDYTTINRSYGMDQTIWCFRQIDGTAADESSGLIVLRSEGRRDFSGRDQTIVRELHRSLSPMVGRHLARFGDPSPADLAPRPRQVLACLLEGDSDKLVALRLRLSRHTVNEYTKLIYRHFGVRSRNELLARWIRRGWGARGSWTAEADSRERWGGRSYSLPI